MPEAIVLENQEAVKKHQELVDKGLILFEAIVGSQSYGTALPTSDIDKKFIYIEPLENILSGNITDQINVSKDYVGYEIKRYMELLSTINPNTQETLNLPLDCILYCHPLFQKYLIDQREKFLTKQARFSFGNYAATQIKKARGTNKKIVNPMPGPRKGLLDFCYITHEQGSKPLKEWLDKKGILPEMCGVVAIDHMKNTFNLFVDILYHFEYRSLEQIPFMIENSTIDKDIIEKNIKEEKNRLYANRLYKGITDKDDVQIVLSSVAKNISPDVTFYCNIEGFSHYCKEYASYQTWLKERNEDRFTDNSNVEFQFDVKNMMHCHRLLDMAVEILRDHKVIVRRPNREQLLEIRAGKYHYEQLIKEAEEKVKLMDELYAVSTLPEKVEKEFIFNLLFQLRKEFYKL